MRTGIKTLTRKALNQLKRPSLLYRGIPKHTFPDKPTSHIKMKAKLYGLESELKQRNIEYNLGSLYTLPHPQTTQVYKRFIDYNPGNLGSWSDDETQTYATTKMEYEVIHDLIDLYNGNQEKLSGYITSGGTEGNIFSVWLGRSYLEQYCKPNEICLLKTSLTHYSVRKAGQLCNVPQFLIPLNKTEWNIDIQGFDSSIQNLYDQGYRGFIIPLTFGYTSTGTCDDIELITQKADKLKRKLKGIELFFWIDAALNGLITPFLDKDFHPFQSPYIQAFLVDFHKFGLVPYPAGIILYQKQLKKLIEQPIDYLAETDSTLLGSRPGIPAVSIWTMIHSLGKNGYKGLIEEEKENKEYFLEQITSVLPKTEIVTHSHSLSCGLIFHGLKSARLPQWIEEKYGLYPGKTKLLFFPNEKREEIIYKCFFLPHMKKKIITNFISDLEKSAIYSNNAL